VPFLVFRVTRQRPSISLLSPFTMAHYDTYREQLANLYHGYALWEPGPGGLYDQVRVGDVGFILHGHFTRFFNALMAADDPNQGYDVPLNFVPLSMGPFPNIRKLDLPHGDYCSNTVSGSREGIGAQIQAAYVIDRKQFVPFANVRHHQAHQMKSRILRLDVEGARVPFFPFPSKPLAKILSELRSLRRIFVGIAIAG